MGLSDTRNPATPRVQQQEIRKYQYVGSIYVWRSVSRLHSDDGKHVSVHRWKSWFESNCKIVRVRLTLKSASQTLPHRFYLHNNNLIFNKY